MKGVDKNLTFAFAYSTGSSKLKAQIKKGSRKARYFRYKRWVKSLPNLVELVLKNIKYPPNL